MAQPGKASIKRGKPSYFMSILGVTLVLFFLGYLRDFGSGGAAIGYVGRDGAGRRACSQGDDQCGRAEVEA